MARINKFFNSAINDCECFVWKAVFGVLINAVVSQPRL